ncbi:uncharacterized protein MCYG_07874 [Microsporum canis CBS 113480]|uniref:Uncharacterized protein n=1 Tax=Arthroderma otae (strain ATCC MYA-4605 / CBS 113480) TaxID=554155 RepID=C5FXL5_ARTOC|nr:uncharacterized protein MCYG_07874 [Microsporum canis CBS 113480]EEQ35055.1 predicted protein [Microsporum canis CBS 113480]
MTLKQMQSIVENGLLTLLYRTLKFCKKVEDDYPLERERDRLGRFRSPYFRFHIDTPVEEHKRPPFLVLDHMDVSLSDTWKNQEGPPLKEAITSVLGALNIVYSRNYIYTGIKPNEYPPL